MGSGKWTRWGGGHGGCEGYGLDVGHGVMSFRSGISRKAVGLGKPEAWSANINGRALGTDYPSKEAAQQAVENALCGEMQRILEDWIKFCAQKPMDPVRVHSTDY